MTGAAAPLELVIFDCDGVLVDSEPIAVRIDKLILERLGMPLTEQEIIERFVGRSPSVMRSALEEHLGRSLADDWDREFRGLYADAYAAELEPIDGIEAALDQISVATCVASSSEPDRLRHKLGLVGLYERFAGRIFSAAQVANGKPAPDLFLFAAERMGAAPEACVVVEDSRHGVMAARAAGMDVFAYTGSVTPAHALAGERTTVFDDMRRLPALLAGR
ncbi:MAG TPA: HAD family hydrolase [Solirubrobacteraceae bacterium]|nr:HAD family hydrolase [Solirubrobacteraceae bacterium]